MKGSAGGKGSSVGGADGFEKGAGRGSGKMPGTTNVQCQFVLKYLAPEVFASAIIGKGGAVIASIRQQCNAKMGLSDHGEVFPQTDCRIITAQANTENDLHEVSKQVIQKLSELVKNTGPSEGVGSEGELRLRVLVPRAAVGGIIGKGGATIKQLRENSGGKVSISEPIGSGPGAEQVVSVTGTEQAIEYVLQEVNRQIQMLSQEQWYATWASTTSVVPAMMGGMGMQGYGGPMGGGKGGGYGHPGIDCMMRVASSLPPYVMEDSRGFAMSCVVPNRLVGGLIGRGGAGTKEVQMITGTKISIREIPDDPDNRSLNIAGPLANTCAAYMMMMKRYLDSEAQSGGAPGATGS
eukprot:TRINITY_DN1156_c0_g1_i1.p1 TRINITY_DN1156_c0_g1~~TRINITY_DN1156_c0_g1_i1.p1  ORF type:complete len:351 (-),score=91.70 TRINITY_DN1156_c0_g1_i1:64-1116(-)